MLVQTILDRDIVDTSFKAKFGSFEAEALLVLFLA